MPEPDRAEPAEPSPSAESPAATVRPGRGSAPRTPRVSTSRRVGSLRRSQRRLTSPPVPRPTAPAPSAPPDEPAPASRRTTAAAWTRLRDSLVRPGRGQVIAAVLLCVVGVAGVAQVRSKAADDAYGGARREDLIELLDGLGSESRRLESEIADLQQTRSELQSGADTRQVARAEAEKRTAELAILAGTAPAQGPGIRIRIADPESKLDGTVLLDAVEEMRDAGAEVIEVDDRIRVVGSSWFSSSGGQLVIDGVPVSRPVTLEVIGDPHSLEEAARFRGGIVSEITGPKIGGQVQIDQETTVVIESLHATTDNKYARPASSAPTPR